MSAFSAENRRRLVLLQLYLTLCCRSRYALQLSNGDVLTFGPFSLSARHFNGSKFWINVQTVQLRMFHWRAICVVNLFPRCLRWCPGYRGYRESHGVWSESTLVRVLQRLPGRKTELAAIFDACRVSRGGVSYGNILPSLNYKESTRGSKIKKKKNNRKIKHYWTAFH